VSPAQPGIEPQGYSPPKCTLPPTPTLEGSGAARLGDVLGMPAGLARLLRRSAEVLPLRIMLADNSGSMMAPDGCVALRDSSGVVLRTGRVTRWEELTATALGSARLAQALWTRLDVTMLNPTPDARTLSLGADSCALVARTARTASLGELQATLDGVSPQGWTPLAEAIDALVALISPVAPTLHAAGHRVVVAIATDCLPDDPPGFLHAVTRLQELPIWLVVRLHTSDEAVIAQWAELDKQLEAPLEVLGGLRTEAAEVHAVNSWLTYAPALHEAREFGLHDKLFDLLDEAPLLPCQVRRICSTLLDCALPQPELDPAAFISAVHDALAHLAPVYEPLSGELRPWVDCDELATHLAALD